MKIASGPRLEAIFYFYKLINCLFDKKLITDY